jgi:hypothetical protein
VQREILQKKLKEKEERLKALETEVSRMSLDGKHRLPKYKNQIINGKPWAMKLYSFYWPLHCECRDILMACQCGMKCSITIKKS